MGREKSTSTSEIIVMNTLFSACYENAYPFDSLFKESKKVIDPRHLEPKESCLVVWGGTDINASLYKSFPHHTTQSPGKVPSQRDVIEWNLMDACIRHGIPIIGICRGAQMLCAKAGGSLIQDVRGHTREHYIKDIAGNILVTSSLHHQMMYLDGVDHKLIAWAYNPKSKSTCIGRNHEMVNGAGVTFKATVEVEPEIVWFPKIKGLAIQGHPEFHNYEDPFVEYCLNKVKEYCFGGRS